MHPVPEDVAGLNTYQIVQKIRCEVRDSLRFYTTKFIAEVHPELAAGLRAGTIDYATFNRKRLHPKVDEILQRYEKTAIAYEFVFDMTENNTAVGSLAFGSVLARGPLTVSTGAGSDKTRRNKRNFRIIDTFEKLTRLLPNRICDAIEKGENAAYPITGSLGMGELIGTFLDLNQSGNLSGDKNIPTLSDTIEFTTIFNAGASGGLKLEPLGRHLRVTDSAIAIGAKREDKHNMTIALTLPPPGGENLPSTLFEKRAFEELERQRTLEIDDETIKIRRSLIGIVN